MSPLFAVAAGSNAALVTFSIYTLIVFGLAIVSSRLQTGKSFLSEYFLGSRNLGMWTFALTFAATSASLWRPPSRSTGAMTAPTIESWS